MRFLPVAVQLQGPAAEFVLQLLNGDFAIEFSIAGSVDGGVATRPDGFEQFVASFSVHRIGPQSVHLAIAEAVLIMPRRRRRWKGSRWLLVGFRSS